MQKTLIQILLMLLPVLATGQVGYQRSSYPLNKYYKVKAKSGLNLRAADNKTSAKLDGIPFGEVVYGTAEFRADTIEGIPGRWISVIYDDQNGFLFSGFLEEWKEGPISFFFPETVPENQNPYPDDITYWGLVYEDPSRVRPCDINLLKTGHYKFVRLKIDSTTNVMDGEVVKTYAPTNVNESVKLVVSGFVPNPKSLTVHFYDGFITPGASVGFSNYDVAKKRERAYSVFATGKPIQGKNDDYRMFTKIEDYHLHFREMFFLGGYGPVEVVGEQTIEHKDIYCDREGSFDVQRLYMTGDFDGDGKADLIFRREEDGGTCQAYFLYLSSKARKGALVKQVATESFCGC